MLRLSVTFVTCRRAVYERVEKWGRPPKSSKSLSRRAYNQVYARDVDLYTMHVPDFATDRHFGKPEDEIDRNVQVALRHVRSGELKGVLVGGGTLRPQSFPSRVD